MEPGHTRFASRGRATKDLRIHQGGWRVRLSCSGSCIRQGTRHTGPPHRAVTSDRISAHQGAATKEGDSLDCAGRAGPAGMLGRAEAFEPLLGGREAPACIRRDSASGEISKRSHGSGAAGTYSGLLGSRLRIRVGVGSASRGQAERVAASHGHSAVESRVAGRSLRGQAEAAGYGLRGMGEAQSECPERHADEFLGQDAWSPLAARSVSLPTGIIRKYDFAGSSGFRMAVSSNCNNPQ